MNQTTLISAKDIDKKWYIVDAADQTVGRLATQVAMVLRGKNKPNFTPHINNGDHVIIINAEKAKFTGKKESDKTYYHHSMHPGGLRRRTVAVQRELDARKILERAIKLMLPKNVQGGNQFRALHVFVGENHPYAAQKPVVLEVNTKKGDNK
ncbi:50S ribosomal protein L13 [Mesoplasma syrphidae]|uniref:Large ribosomal subunit protein uL13 n=1 Tax=Mesoplasma syrphidae TaxID=225999 RepID=A0A2K9BUF5_9MOLU|nr:50S ribosomal protein L13 [Mesoplasma syrphidae]AUF83340.1 50S ribosomal protein L13 [Mesoplasma syrphidae]